MTEIILKTTPPLGVDGFTFDLQRFDGGDNWSDYAAISFSSQNGITITINSAEELALLAKNVNSGTTYEGYTIKLGANIDLSGHNWTPIGKDNNNSFKGTFDGNNANYTISNLTVNSGNYVGLFGSVGESGTVKNVTLKNVNITGSSEIGALVGWNGGTISGCTVSGKVTGTSNVGGIVGYQYGGTVSGNTVFSKVSGNNYVGGLVGTNTSGGTVSGNKYYTNQTKEVGLNSTNNGVTNNTRYYSITVLEGVTFTFTGGDTITDGTNTYYASGTTFTLTLTAGEFKDGYAFSTGDSFTITQDTTVTVTLDTENHYVLADDTKTLATADNTTKHPELVQVYALTLQGVTVTGDKVAKDSNGNYYAAGDITVAAKTGYTYSGSTTLTVTEDKTVSATFDTENHYVLADDTKTLATADNTTKHPELVQVYALTLQGVTVTGDKVAKDSNGNYYAAGDITVAAKTGYTYSGSTTLTVTEDKTVSATFDTANHYVLADDTKTLATAENVGSYPNLVQVYELTVPDSLKVTGDTVATANGKTYAAGEVTLTAAKGYTIQSISVDGSTLDGTTFTVNAAAEISAESFKSINGGKGVEFDGTTGDFSAESGVYSITASQQNSTLKGNNNNNTVVLEGGGENILTGGGGNDTYKFKSGGGIVTDFGIGAAKDSNGKALSAPSGSDIVKVSGTVSGIYFDRNASSKKSAKFTAVITYGSDDVQGDDTQIIVLQNINKKPTKYGSNPVYQTNDVAAATLKIWDTSGSKQAVLSASKLKKLFHDDSELSDLSATVQTQLVKLNGIGDLNLPAVDQLNQTAQATFNGGNNG